MTYPRCTGACNQGRSPCNCMTAARPRTSSPGVPVVIHCHRTSLLRRAGWLLADLWDFLISPRFRG